MTNGNYIKKCRDTQDPGNVSKEHPKTRLWETHHKHIHNLEIGSKFSETPYSECKALPDELLLKQYIYVQLGAGHVIVADSKKTVKGWRWNDEDVCENSTSKTAEWRIKCEEDHCIHRCSFYG